MTRCMSWKCVLALIAAGGFVYASPAQAGVEMKFLELEPGVGVGGIKLKNADMSQTTSAGQLLWDVHNETGTPALPVFDSPRDADTAADNLLTFCIELGQVVSTNWHAYAKTDLTLAPDPHISSLPLGAKVGGQRAGLLDLLADHFWDDAGLSDVNAAAFQLATWEIVHESTSASPGNPAPSSLGLGIGQGTFYVNMASPTGNILSALNLANLWLGMLSSLTPNDHLSLIALTHPRKQDQIVQIASPEPGALCVWLGVLGAASMTRRRR